MQRTLLSRPSHITSLLVLARKWFVNFTVADFPFNYLCCGHHMVAALCPHRNRDVVALTEHGIRRAYQEETS